MPHKRTTPKIFHRAKQLRHNLTPAEKKLWARLRNHQLNGLGFRRQHALGQFIVDFCCPHHQYIVELDGHTHANQVEYDQARTAWLESHGWRVRRFTNSEIEKNLEGVLATIIDDCASKSSSRSPQLLRDRSGSGA
jgi:very-short-patch-repair endonuclease